MFSSAKPSFCSNFQTYKKEFPKKIINPIFFSTKELASTFSTRFALDRLFMSLESESNWAQIFLQMAKYTLDDGYEFQIKRLLGLRNSKIKQKCLQNVKQHAQMAKSVKMCNIGRLYYLGICFKCRNHSTRYYLFSV